jgi:hypothetical protein
MHDIEDAVKDPSLPVYEIDEHLSVLSGRIDGGLYDELSNLLSDFKEKCASGANDSMRYVTSNCLVLR